MFPIQTRRRVLSTPVRAVAVEARHLSIVTDAEDTPARTITTVFAPAAPTLECCAAAGSIIRP